MSARSTEEWIGASPDSAIPKRVRWVSPKKCSFEGCERPTDSHGLCGPHASRFRRYGDASMGGTARGAAADFMKNVVLKHDADECLAWPFGNNGKGYGVFHENGRVIAAHTYACREAHGARPSSKHEVAHSCGRGHLLCCAPKHLRWATRKENHADKARHGTLPFGQNNPSNKLTPDQVLAIRDLGGTEPQHQIAKRFGVCQMTISNILSGKVWGWLK